MAEDYLAFAAGKDQQVLFRADVVGEEVSGSRQGSPSVGTI